MNSSATVTVRRQLPIDGLWCVHSYYTLCPYAPDGSGRIVLAGADPETGVGEVLVLGPDGAVIDRFGRGPVTPSFWHTGFWQSWSPDGKYVYFQSGSHMQPYVVRRHLTTGDEVRMPGDMEGIPPLGEPGLSCSHGLLYAAGYGDGKFKPELAPVPFLDRDRHGINRLSFDPPCDEQVLSTQRILDAHPDRQRLERAERELQSRLGDREGLTLMTYCVRWNRQGTRMLFYFGNHCVARSRGEPRVAYVFTCDRDMREMHLALDLFERRGVHWGWQPDGEKLIGYGPDANRKGQYLAEVRYDGSDYRILSDHNSGGHPSVCPANPDLIVTDEQTDDGGAVVFIDRSSGRILERVHLPKYIGDREPGGRNPLRVCHHPVFNHSGDRLLCNSLPGRLATLVELEVRAG